MPPEAVTLNFCEECLRLARECKGHPDVFQCSKFVSNGLMRNA